MIWFLLVCVALGVWGALWWSRRLMRAADVVRRLPRAIRSQAEFESVFGQPRQTPCFACGHAPSRHLDPKVSCDCCAQTELIEAE